VRRRKKSPHARARLASPVGAKGARRLREWSAEIRLFALQERGLAKINLIELEFLPILIIALPR
jgi:hypothetical protein